MFPICLAEKEAEAAGIHPEICIVKNLNHSLDTTPIDFHLLPQCHSRDDP